ncbi:MAG: IS66 family insertion sequence element accessory protein TnpB [Desulfonatronovibrio sp.]|nr:IS66 family insertion sequence element accessory protein TnpB [Desulfovibrionales bacterium]
MDIKSTASSKSLSRSEFWAEHLRKQKQSGLSKIGYIRKHGLSKHAFYYWSKKLDSENRPQNSIVPLGIKLIQPRQCDYQPISIHVSNRFKLDIAGDFDPVIVGKLVKTLEEIP